jgi:hypothetical protein
VNQFVKIVPGDGLQASLLSLCLYYLQRLVTTPFLRRQVARLIARGIRSRHDKPPAQADSPEAMQLKQAGCASLGELLSAEQCADIHAFLRDKTLSDRHGAQEPFTLATRPDAVRIAEYDLADIINCPHLLALANSPRVIGLAQQYLDCKPTLSSLMLRWSFPTDAPAGNVQQFHRDSDDWRHLKVMVYLTDVGAADGPHVYVPGTHKEAAPMRIQVEDDAAIDLRYGEDAAKVIIGSAGYGFAVDTAGIHKGEMPRARPRLMLQMQYSMLPVFANRYRPQRYLGALAFDRYVNRLLVA